MPHLSIPDALRKHCHDTPKQRYFTCAQLISKLFRYCGGKEKLIATSLPDTRWPLTQKLQLFSFITCVAGRRLPLLSISLPCRLIFKAIPECSSSLGHFFSRHTRMKWQALRRMGKWSNILNISFISSVYSNVSSNLKACQWKGFTRYCNKLFTQ